MAETTESMAEEDLRAFDPVHFPEMRPGVEFNANFCRNPMCPNFGPAPVANTVATDSQSSSRPTKTHHSIK